MKNAQKQNGEECTNDPFLSLKLAADRVARLLCELSQDNSLFVSGSEAGTPQKRLDTKSLKEFSAVIKEMSGVMSELYSDRTHTDGVRIEFSDEAYSLGA